MWRKYRTRYSEKYIHTAMKSGFTNNDATYKLTLDKTKYIHF